MRSEYRALAQKYGVTMEAIDMLTRSLRTTGGKAAQFNHPELGGLGQWMPGMIMIGEMNNETLKARIDGLCRELALLIANESLETATSALAGVTDKVMTRIEADEARLERAGVGDEAPAVESAPSPATAAVPSPAAQPTPAHSSQWWPESLGRVPDASGAQSEFAYAYFARSNRLLIRQGGQITMYDTTGYRVYGVRQQQQRGKSRLVVSAGTREFGLDMLSQVPLNPPEKSE